MSDDDLRARLARVDPVRRVDVAALVESRSAEEIRERAMQTIEAPPAAPPRRRRTPVLLGAAAAAVAVAVAGGVLATRDSGGSGLTPAPAVTTLALQTQDNTSMQSCIAFDVAILRDMPVAFGGTVTSVEADTVTLDVDRWYRGGSADRVTVSSPNGAMVSIEGVEFAAGTRYLVTATDGVVNACGFSGPATAELEQAYGEAFGG
jgi:hypothetical protein